MSMRRKQEGPGSGLFRYDSGEAAAANRIAADQHNRYSGCNEFGDTILRHQV